MLLNFGGSSTSSAAGVVTEQLEDPPKFHVGVFVPSVSSEAGAVHVFAATGRRWTRVTKRDVILLVERRLRGDVILLDDVLPLEGAVRRKNVIFVKLAGQGKSHCNPLMCRRTDERHFGGRLTP